MALATRAHGLVGQRIDNRGFMAFVALVGAIDPCRAKTLLHWAKRGKAQRLAAGAPAARFRFPCRRALCRFAR